MAPLLSPGAIEDAEAPPLDHGKLDWELWERAQRDAAQPGAPPLVEILLSAGIPAAEAELAAAARDLGIEWTRLRSLRIPPGAIATVPASTARKHRVLPLGLRRGTLLLAVAPPLDLAAIDALARRLGRFVEPCLVDREELQAAIERHYGLEADLVAATRSAARSPAARAPARPRPHLAPELAEGEEGVAVRIVDLIVATALEQRASDVHLEPERDGLSLKFRIDGVLLEKPAPPPALHPALVTRVKVLAGLDVAETRRPQDGAFHADVSGRRVDVRVSILPTVSGESVVLRLLDRAQARRGIEALGLLPEERERILAAFERPEGLVLACGPTGAGKTTTLYALLERARRPELHIVSIEDPVEYELEGVRQVQVNEAAGVTFATGLRSILRHDPDVVLVGEIRDTETARLAVQAALTGHLVLATLHARGAVGAIPRLFDLGVPPYLLAATLRVAIAQRLVRLLCADCREIEPPDPALRARLPEAASESGQFMVARGCERCERRGARGRTAVFEVLVASGKIRRLIAAGAPEDAIRAQARREGFRTLFESGLERARAGEVALSELARVTALDEGEEAAPPPLAQAAPATAAAAPTPPTIIEETPPLGPPPSGSFAVSSIGGWASGSQAGSGSGPAREGERSAPSGSGPAT